MKVDLVAPGKLTMDGGLSFMVTGRAELWRAMFRTCSLYMLYFYAILCTRDGVYCIRWTL